MADTEVTTNVTPGTTVTLSLGGTTIAPSDSGELALALVKSAELQATAMQNVAAMQYGKPDVGEPGSLQPTNKGVDWSRYGLVLLLLFALWKGLK